MRAMAWCVVCAIGSACSGNEPREVDDPRRRELSELPAWSAYAPRDPVNPDERCFATSVAVADLDGDRQPELIVAESSCLLAQAQVVRIAIYRGIWGAFAPAPVWSTLTVPPGSRAAFHAVVDTGDIDGDHRADLLVRMRSGVQVFRGIDPRVPLGAPVFQLPGTGNVGQAHLADFDGDRRDDLVALRGGNATVYLSTPTAPTPFTAARTFVGISSIYTADTNRDGRADLVTATSAQSQLWRGCRAGQTCVGGLRSAPQWTIARTVVGLVPDANGDGLHEALVGDAFGAHGRVWMFASDRGTGGLSAAPVWSTLGDPEFPLFGVATIDVGDLDGDRRTTDFVITSWGRAYAFFVRREDLDESLAPAFAWPRAIQRQTQHDAGEPVYGAVTLAVAAAGDLDRDGRDDLVIGAEHIAFTDSPDPGQVHLFRGGRLPAGPLPPYLATVSACPAPGGGLPDLWIDPEVTRRSLYVDEREFAPDSCEMLEGCVGGDGVRKLLRFSTSVANRGRGSLVIPGPESAPHLYHYDACHGHDHVTDFVRYELRDASGQVVVTGRKQGFFLVDVAPYCLEGEDMGDYFPDQGITAGWADVYDASIACQWIDVTGVPPGAYALEITADALGIVEQADEYPDTAVIDVVIGADSVEVK